MPLRDRPARERPEPGRAASPRPPSQAAVVVETRARTAGAAGPFGSIDLEVEHVVERGPRGVEHHRRRDQRQPAPGLGERAGHEQPAGQAVGRGGHDVGQPDQLQVGRDRLGHRARSTARFRPG